MEDAEIYRRLAPDCVERARANADAEAAAGLLRLSRYWLQKALKAEHPAERTKC
jgi:hypothetical protein